MFTVVSCEEPHEWEAKWTAELMKLERQLHELEIGSPAYESFQNGIWYCRLRLRTLQVVEKERKLCRFVRLCYAKCYPRVLVAYGSIKTTPFDDGGVICTFCGGFLEKGEKAESIPGVGLDTDLADAY